MRCRSPLDRVFGKDPHLLALRTGRWRWPWAVVGTIVGGLGIFAAIAVMAQLRDVIDATSLSSLSLSGAASAAPDNPDDIRLLVPGDPSSYAVLLLAFVPVLLVPLATYRIVHGRDWADWPYRGADDRWREFANASVAFLLVVGVGFAIAWLLFPSRFQFIPRDIGHLKWFVLGLVVVLVQAFAEEVAFKGYLYRVWGAVLPYRWPLIILLSAAFTSLHWDNSDFARDRGMAVIQFMVGSAISFWLYTRTQGLAAPTGLHWANNIFAMLILASTPGEFGASALATYTDPVLAAGRSNLFDFEAWLALVLGNAAFLGLVAHPASPLHIRSRGTDEVSAPPPPAPPASPQ